MVSFFKRKSVVNLADTVNNNNEIIENLNAENLEFLANKFSHLPYLQPCDTISAHEKHTLPQAKQIFTADSCRAEGGTGEEYSKRLVEPEVGVEEQKVPVAPPSNLKDVTQDSSQRLNLLNAKQEFNRSAATLSAEEDQDRLATVSSTIPEAVYLSAIPKEYATSIPLRKTVSFQETVTTHTHADFEARLEEIRRQKLEERRYGFFGRLKTGLKRLFLCRK